MNINGMLSSYDRVTDDGAGIAFKIVAFLLQT